MASGMTMRFRDNQLINKLADKDVFPFENESGNDRKITYENLMKQLGGDFLINTMKLGSLPDSAFEELGKRIYLEDEGNNRRINQLADMLAEAKARRYNILHDGGKQIYLRDGFNNEDDMFFLPKFKCEEICPDGELGYGTHPAFIVGYDADTNEPIEVEGIYIGRFHAHPVTQAGSHLNGGTVNNGDNSNDIPVSAEGYYPWVNISWEQSRYATLRKNRNGVTGYHMINIWEWSAICLWAMKYGVEPTGNINSSAAWQETSDYRYSHNRKMNGVMHMVGNVWDWCDLCKTTTTARLMVPDYNAYEKQINEKESEWNVIDKELPDTANGGGYRAFYDKFLDFGKDLPEDQYMKLKRLCMSSNPRLHFPGGYWITKNQESVLFEGGSYVDRLSCSLFIVDFLRIRSSAYSRVGFRFSKIEL